MSRRAFLGRSAWAAAALGGLGGLLEACSRGGPVAPGLGASGPVDFAVSTPSGSAFPGGITRQSDGSYYIVYQFKPSSGHDNVRGRKLANLRATPGPQETFYAGTSIDPSDVTMPTGETVILLHAGGDDALLTRRPDGSFSARTVVGPAAESMISRVGDRVFIAFAQLVASPFVIPVMVRRVLSPTTFGPAVDTGARTGAAQAGGQSAQKRSSVGGVGPSELLLAWNQPQTPTGGYRSIWIARSPDDGTTWGAHTKVADIGRDIRNPFVLQVSPSETRVYWEQGGGGGNPPLGWVGTTDAGTTWSSPADVPVPSGVTGGARPSFLVDGGTIYCFAGWSTPGGHVLGIFPV